MPDPDVLIQRYLEGLLTEPEAAHLHDLLRHRPELIEPLLTQLELDAMLRHTRPVTTAELDFLLPHLPPTEHPAPARRFSSTAVTAIAALAASIALLATLLWPEQDPRSAPDLSETTTSSVAVLTRGVSLDWETTPLQPGTPLAPGRIKLRSGIAVIEFYQGARVQLEGPADLDIISAGEAAFHLGKLSAQVPPQARGFRIHTPEGTVVDLGTEFALNIGPDKAQVHVFKGEVELHPLAHSMQTLREGQALTFGGDSAPTPLAADPVGFASSAQLEALSSDSLRSDFAHWLTRSASLNRDPSLLLRFDFQDPPGPRLLHNQAHASTVEDAGIVGATWTQGRWPGKQALDFRNVSDRVRLAIPGDLPALTLAAWVRIYGLDRTFNSLFMSESWGDRRIHWQITREGRVRLGIAGSGTDRHIDYDTPPIFPPERFGRWTHLAVVFDPATREVRHYADGIQVASLPLTDASPLRPGIAEIGNWSDHRQLKGGAPIRHLSGAMDEFALWQRALTAEEIRELHR
jgi:hypothetical protein